MPPPPPPPPVPQISQSLNSTIKLGAGRNNRNQLLGDIHKGIQLKSAKHMMIDKSKPLIQKESVSTVDHNSSSTIKLKSRSGSVSQSAQPLDFSSMFINGVPKVKLRPVSAYIPFKDQTDTKATLTITRTESTNSDQIKPQIPQKPQLRPKPTQLPTKPPISIDPAKKTTVSDGLNTPRKPLPPPPPPQSSKPLLKLTRSASYSHDIGMPVDLIESTDLKPAIPIRLAGVKQKMAEADATFISPREESISRHKEPKINGASASPTVLIGARPIDTLPLHTGRRNTSYVSPQLDASSDKIVIDINPGSVGVSHGRHKRIIVTKEGTDLEPAEVLAPRSDLNMDLRINGRSESTVYGQGLRLQRGSLLGSQSSVSTEDIKGLDYDCEKKSSRQRRKDNIRQNDSPNKTNLEKQFKFHSSKDFPSAEEFVGCKKIYPSRCSKNPNNLKINKGLTSPSSVQLKPNLETTV